LPRDCWVSLSREHFLDGQANPAGKIALELLWPGEVGDAAFRFHGAIEAAVHFVEEHLTGL
jgi:hypothetical protein